MKYRLSDYPKLQEFVRFCVVGVLCTVIDAGIYYSLYRLTGYRVAMVCGFVVSLGVNYILNTYWSFRQTPSVKTAIGIVAAHCLNIFVVRMGLMWIFVSCLLLDAGIAYIPTLMISMVTNFLVIRAVYVYWAK